MTTQEFVKKEGGEYSEKVSLQVLFNGTNDFYDEQRYQASMIDFSAGLTKGLEIGFGFREWYKENKIRYLGSSKEQLKSIYLTEKYRK